MKQIFFTKRISILFLLFISVFAQAQNGIKKYEYKTVPNDPIETRIYTLENGLKIYLSVNEEAPRIQTHIAVRAGSKDDPADATGLAHYLEHMLFKGTDRYGTLDYAKEKEYLDQIENIYEKYRKTKDEAERKKLYAQIDSLGQLAGQHAIPNEYDKMVSAIGAKGTNAHTSFEETVYHNDIPANQLENWLILEAERFRYPVMRLFHTELETVYEEKNTTLDNDMRKLMYAMLENLFPTHNYGQQTTIGTIEHLKNPSITEIRNYYEKNYVPNNMAFALAGDLDPDKTIALIDKYFGSFPAKNVEPYKAPVEKPITQPIIKKVYGPAAETMSIAFRMPGVSSVAETDLLIMVNKVLYNGKAGLIDLNLAQKQRVIKPSSSIWNLTDYSVHWLSGDLKEGQSMDEVRDLLLAELDKVKKGDFPEWLPTAIVNNMKLDEIKSFENNSSRARAFYHTFITRQDWADYINRNNRLEKITKQQIVDFANKYYGDNYVAVYKINGEDPNVIKVEKPEITPITVNREAVSPFVSDLLARSVDALEPVFLDYNKDIQKLSTPTKLPVHYMKNSNNNLFNLYYIFDMGNNHDQKMSIAVEYLPFLGTSKYSPDALQQEFYKLGCSFSVNSGDESIFVSVSGLSDNFDKALELFEHLIADAQPNAEAYDNLVMDILKKRADAKLSKQTILNVALVNYAVYGNENPFTNKLSAEELKNLNPAELTEKIKNLTSYKHRVLYYGPLAPEKLTASINKYHKTPSTLKPVPQEKEFTERDMDKTMVYVVDYDMQQAEIMMIRKGASYDPKLTPVINAYNEYFGGGMSSIVFQELRESKALAYSTWSVYRSPSRKDRSFYTLAYIGSQADKLPEAMTGMTALLTEMPVSEGSFNNAREAIIQKIRTERIMNASVLFNYERARKLGLEHDIRKDVFTAAPAMTINQIRDFHKQYISGGNYNIMVLGKKDRLNLEELEKYGEIKYLTLEEIFGY
jgi:zinc protease